jgi:hypothetical protein
VAVEADFLVVIDELLAFNLVVQFLPIRQEITQDRASQMDNFFRASNRCRRTSMLPFGYDPIYDVEERGGKNNQWTV